MDLGAHLPLMQFGPEPLGRRRLFEAVDGARECGFSSVSSNDHFLFATPWLDGPTALAAVIDRTGSMTVATTIALAVLREPVRLAKTFAALDILSEGRFEAGIGPGSSERDYEALGIPFEERWPRFEESIVVTRALLRGEVPPADARFYELPEDIRLAPMPVQPDGPPLWIGSWGSKAGMRRVARLGDAWLASAYNTTPDRFAEGRELLATELEKQGRPSEGFPNSLATMWIWVTDEAADRDRALRDVLAPLLRRDPDELAGQVCIGSPGHCAALLNRYAEAGCHRVFLWPLGDEPSQLERIAAEVAPQLPPSPSA